MGGLQSSLCTSSKAEMFCCGYRKLASWFDEQINALASATRNGLFLLAKRQVTVFKFMCFPYLIAQCKSNKTHFFIPSTPLKRIKFATFLAQRQDMRFCRKQDFCFTNSRILLWSNFVVLVSYDNSTISKIEFELTFFASI